MNYLFYDLDYNRLILLTVATFIIAAFCYTRLATSMQRAFLLAGMLGLYIYSGFGGAHSIVPEKYLAYYLLFVFSMAIAFLLTIKMTDRLFMRNCASITIRTEYFLRNSSFNMLIIATYIFCLTFPLIYPEIKLSLLWNPPAPDLATIFNFGVPIKRSNLVKYLNYIGYFLYPFYLIIISRFLPKRLTLLLFLILPVYIEYCVNAYVGRSVMGMAVVMFVLTLLFTYPHRRRRIIVVTIFSIPIILVLFSAYAYMRESTDIYKYMSFTDHLIKIAYDETRFPIFAQQVMQYAASVDLLQYARYIFLYPVPGEKINIGFDIAELIMNMSVGKEGFSVTLSGPVAESIYIYGVAFFWVQALFIGIVFGILCRFSESIYRYPILGTFFITLWGYKFARAGISSIWPIIALHMIPFYLITSTNILYRIIPRYQLGRESGNYNAPHLDSGGVER